MDPQNSNRFDVSTTLTFTTHPAAQAGPDTWPNEELNAHDACDADAFSYAAVGGGSAIELDEVEDAAVHAVEVIVRWGATVMRVAHLSPPRSFCVGEEETADSSCDVLVPIERLGTSRLPLVRVEGGLAYAVIPAGAKARVAGATHEAMSLEGAVAAGLARPCVESAGSVEVALTPGVRVYSEIGGFTFEVASVARGRRTRSNWSAAATDAGVMFVGLSFVAHLVLLASMAYFKPTLGGARDDEALRERARWMEQMLTTSAEVEDARVDTSSEGVGAEAGTPAKAPEGRAGDAAAKATGKRMAVSGNADNPQPRISRRELEDDARHSALAELVTGSARAVMSSGVAFTADTEASGRDDRTLRGGLFGPSVGEDVGVGGLGVHGDALGGGSPYDGVAGNGVTTKYGGTGRCGEGAKCSAAYDSRRLEGHTPRGPKMTPVGITQVGGKLAPEVIQRIVRQHYGQFRMCYEAGLRTSPSLAGRVVTGFVIGRDGAVANVGNRGSDLPDTSVVQCVVRAFGGLSFPEPEGGVVSVVYPIAFSPGSLPTGRVDAAACVWKRRERGAGGSGQARWRAGAM